MKPLSESSRYFILIAFALSTLAGCATSTKNRPGEDLLISERGIGPVKIGMTVAQVKAKLGSGFRVILPEATNSAELAAWYRVMDSTNEEVWRFLVRDWQRPTDSSPIVQIRTTRKSFRTAEGVGAGSSIAAGQKVWGQATFTRNEGGFGREELRFKKQPAYFGLTSRSYGFARSGIYGPISAEAFTQPQTTTLFRAETEIYSVTVKRLQSPRVVRSVRPRQPAAGTVPVNAPPMRGRVGAFILE